jgi:hypothetical protein
MASSVEIRGELVEALRLDLIGPDNSHAFANELLPAPPSRWYLTGFLVPTDAPMDQRADETSTEQIESGGDSEGLDDASPPDRGAARRSLLPSSMGLSILVAPGTESLDVTIQWGDYIWESGDKTVEPDPQTMVHGDSKEEPGHEEGQASKIARVLKGYRRIPRQERVKIDLPKSEERRKVVEVPDSGGLIVSVTSREVGTTLRSNRLPKDTTSVSLFLVNKRKPDPERMYKAFVFQTSLTLESTVPFVPRPDLRGAITSQLGDEWDEQVADLQYRDAYEFAVGHGVSVSVERQTDGRCCKVSTNWLPAGIVERVAPSLIPDVELGMEALGQLKNGNDAKEKLSPLVHHYREWIKSQAGKLGGLEERQTDTAKELLKLAEYAASRIESGISALADGQVLEAFCIANRSMAQAARRRDAIQFRKKPELVDVPKWRPFQLAFILMTLRGIAEPLHNDREIVDLLFFPTGGGKTEAYLGLAAFTMVLRRMRHPGIRSAGVTVLMRYTLRLLTLDQLSRAAALVCALEIEREKDTTKLGEWPFEIGLWVGTAATPNRMGYQGYNGPGADSTAYAKWRRFANNNRSNPAPIPIENCPWCGTKFEPSSFRLYPNPTKPTNLLVHCANHECEFSGDRPLPILGVDEPIYRRLPAFVIATVDKFAALPWTGQAGTLFGLVDRFDRHGFYGPSEPKACTSLGGNLPAPELIIQDELHLISGPLGTIAGLYETAIEALASRMLGEKAVKPKIVASTATVRRAASQINALFERKQVSVFPPQGPDRRDSFFAQTESPEVSPARMYVGVAAQGRSLKVVLLRAALTLLSRAQTVYDREGGKQNRDNATDPYMTLLGYFNSLRELGGSRRIVEDEVKTRLDQYSRRRRRDPLDTLFSNRTISYEVLELTSRVSTGQIAAAKRRLASSFHSAEHVDVALATNMISVGLDIIRLGLMVVLGQPKSSAEYIQATSRVGRDPKRPGLVVTLLNVHKPRDRSHFERFENFHSTFYRAVEPTSVTPFSPRALDRALVAALVGLSRQGKTELTPAIGASEILQMRTSLEQFASRFAERAQGHDARLSSADAQLLHDKVLARCRSLLDDWLNIAQQFAQTNTRLQYQRWETGGAQRLLYDILDPELENLPAIRRRFRANRSMRDVEPSIDIVVKNLNDWPNNP